MEKKIILTLDKAKEWYNKDAIHKELALRAFNENELRCNFENITTFKDACDALDIDYDKIIYKIESISEISRATTALFKLSIIRKALNLGYKLNLVENSNDSHIFYPYTPFIAENSSYYRDKLNSGEMEVLGTIRSEGILYTVLNGNPIFGGDAGLGDFNYIIDVGYAYAHIGFLGCATKEIARHFGKYFGMLITEAKYANIVNFEIIDDKFGTS